MNHFDAFSCLCIPITKDPSVIKKAYQKLIPHHHPEEDPQGFMQLHQAYKIALAYAQGANSLKSPSAAPSWQPEKIHPSREETGYDSLFADLDSHSTPDMEQQKKAFSRQLRKLRLHWLPIPLKDWARFFSSEAYLCCRTDEECLKKLFELLEGKIHTYPVLLYLLNRLWELDIWLKSESMAALSIQTRSCINELSSQYHFCLKRSPTAWTTRLFFRPLWYYEALPFYFKLFVASFLIPLLSLGSGDALLLMLIGFYILEFCIFYLKIYRKLGVFHPTMQKKKGVITIKSRGDSGLFIVLIIYALIGHMWLCLAVMELIMG